MGALPPQLRPLRPARRPDRRDRGRRVGARAAPLAAARDRGPRHPRPHPPLPRQRPLLARRDAARSPRACSATARACSTTAIAPAPVRARGRHLRAARAVDAAAPLHRHVRRPRLPRARAGAARTTRRSSRYLHGRTGEVLLERMRALYAAEVTMTDRWLGVFLDRFHELGLERDTVMVLVSDHGFYLGDYGYTGKIATVLHPPLIQTPLIVIDPRAPPRRAHEHATARRPTTSGPTVLSMAGVRRAARHGRGGPVALLRGQAPARAALLVRRLRQQLLRAHRSTGRCTGPTAAAATTCSTTTATRARAATCRARTRARRRELHGVVRRRAGRLPTLPVLAPAREQRAGARSRSAARRPS